MEEAHQRALVQLKKLEQQVEHGRAALRDRERELAALGDPPVHPPAPWVIGLLGTLGIAATMVLTFHDIIFARLVAATDRALILSGLFGLPFAALVVWGLISDAEHERAKWTHWIWVGVVLLFGMALVLIRSSGGHSDADRLLGYGLAGLEMVSLIIIELFVHGLRLRFARYREERGAFAVAEQHVAVAKNHLADRLQDYEACRAELREHDRQVSERESLVRSTPLAVAASREAVLLGYEHGLAAMQGHLHGASTRLPERDEIVARLSGVAMLAGHEMPTRSRTGIGAAGAGR
jgi:hypothetical protein